MRLNKYLVGCSLATSMLLAPILTAQAQPKIAFDLTVVNGTRADLVEL